MPFVGASPDGYVVCDCHGRGAVEVKCPAEVSMVLAPTGATMDL